MAKLLKILNPEISAYKDRRFDGTQEQWDLALKTSTTVYVGNLSFFTREEQIYDVFSRTGHVQRIVMGLDKKQKTPCGFCFVMYYTRAEADDCVKYLNGTILDDRPIRVDHDWGFVEGRQWGRGRSGGQVRDEFRQDYDPGRGGFGKIIQQEVMSMQAAGMQGLDQEMQQGEGEDQGQGQGQQGEGQGQAAAADGEEGGRQQQDTYAYDQKRQRGGDVPMVAAGSGADDGEPKSNPRFRRGDSDDEGPRPTE